jgi:exocyst complex component 2
MALEVVKLYISLISTFFSLSDISVAESSRQRQGVDDSLPIPPFVPAGTTVLAACYFGEKLVEDVNEGIGELMGVDIGSEAGSGLKNMLDSLRWRLQDVISALWARGECLTISLDLSSNCAIHYFVSALTAQMPRTYIC